MARRKKTSRGLGSVACESIDRRADHDYAQLQKAWQRLKSAQARIQRLRGGRTKYNPRAAEKARAALTQADGEVRAASERINRAFTAVNHCHRRNARAR